MSLTIYFKITEIGERVKILNNSNNLCNLEYPIVNPTIETGEVYSLKSINYYIVANIL